MTSCSFTKTPLVQAELLQHRHEPVVLGQLGKLDVDAAAQAGAQVGGTGKDEAQVLVPHELIAWVR